MSSSNSSKKDIGKSGNTNQISPAKKWCFTLHYKEKCEGDKMWEEIKCGFSSIISKCGMAKELGKSGETPHIQGFVIFKKKLRPLSLKLRKEIHWEKMKGTLLQNIVYCSKEEGEKYFFGCETLEKLKVLSSEILYPWQKEIINIVEGERDDRKIYWIFEEEGCTGKSALCKKLAVEYNAIICGGKASDMKYCVYQMITAGKNVPLVIMDVPRKSNKYLSYQGMEEIKNGCFFNNKYESGMCLMNSPHMFVFSNEPPVFRNMSLDRWVIFKIEDKKLRRLDLSWFGIKDNIDWDSELSSDDEL